MPRPYTLLPLALLLPTVLGACASMRAECRRHEGPEWREVETAHFRIRTDFDSRSAHRAAAELERFRRALLVSFGPELDPPGKLRVILLRNVQELEEFAGKDVAGYWTGAGMRPRIVMAARSSMLDAVAIPDLVRHELAHSVLAHVLLRQPRWVAEGMAEYLQTVQLKADGTVDMGRANTPALVNVRTHGHHTLEELWAWDREAPERDALPNLYASSWAWVSYLMNEHPDAFAAFLERLARAEEPRAAWRAAFPGADPRAMDPLVRRFLRVGRLSVLNVPLPEVEVTPVERPLPEAEVHVVRAELHLMGMTRRHEEHLQAARREVAQALALDPGSVGAALLQVELGPEGESRLRSLRALVGAHPESGEAWRELGQALADADATEGEVRAALVRAVELLPDDAEALNSLAWHHVSAGRAGEALAPATRAAQLTPWSPSVLDTYAAVMAELGRCPEALQVQQRAVDVLPDTAEAGARAALLRRLAEYQARCAAQAAPAVP